MPPRRPEQGNEQTIQGTFDLAELDILSPERQTAYESSRPMALVHILTPEFHGFDPADFADIPDTVVERATADDLRQNLWWRYVPKPLRETPELSSFSFQLADGSIVSVALTPEEYDTASESVAKLADRIFNNVLSDRDAKLRKVTGDRSARARTDEDLRVARRGAMRGVIKQQTAMEGLLTESIDPKLELIERFIEMAQGRNANLARGTRETVSQRFEELRTTIFDDMLDAVAIQRRWTPEMTARARSIIQKRLYVSGTAGQRVNNFREMLDLAKEYYGYKKALILTKVEDAKRYRRSDPQTDRDIELIDEQRSRDKEAKQLRFDQPT